MDILISIAAKIVEYTVAPIGRQVGYLIFYKDNFDELQDQVKELDGAKEHIKQDIEVERRSGKEIELVVQNWLKEVDEITEAVNKLSEDPRRTNAGCSRWSFPDLKSRHQLSRKAKKMARNVAQVHAKGKFDRIGYLPPLDVVSMASTIRGSEKLVSRNRIKDDIVWALKDPKVSKIGVYGLSGVGKTTIVKEVAKQVKDDKLFDAVVMADVTQTPDLKRIQDEIAEQLGLQFEEKTLLVRACRLRERIKKEQTVLIILDDIWENFDLEKIGIPLDIVEVHSKGKFERINHEGCKILLISRKQDTLQNMETQKDFRLEVLNGEETWSLFEVMVGDAIKDDNLHSIAHKVAAKCGGLPVLVVTVARALKNKDIYCWKDALNQLATVGDGGLKEIAYSALEISYKQLESNELKTLFFLCGTLGAHYSISVLLKYGIGLGIFKHVSTMEDARNKFHSMISDLKASCLLLETDTNEWVRMHDIVCEVATTIAYRDQFVFILKENSQLKDWPTEDFLKRCTQIILEECYIQKFPERLDCPNLKFFHIIKSRDNCSLKLPHNFFEGMKNLEVLDLLGMIISSLPTSLAFLTKLQTLCLDQCVLGDMAGIGSLKDLKILSLVESSMIELPSEIGQLIHLRMLDLSNTGFEIFPSNVLSNLTELEELYMGNTSIKWELQSLVMENGNASLAELKHLKNLTALQIQILEVWMLPRSIIFEKLERYKIVIGDIWEWYDEHEAPRLLKLKLKTNIHLEHGIKALIKRVEDLYLDEVNGILNVLYHLNEEGFPLLKHLHIQNNAELQHILNSRERNQTHVFFPKLETLSLHNLTNLEKICHGSLTSHSFGKLKVIKVKRCDQLEYLFSVSIVKDLSQLLEIEVSECISMKNIVSIESIDSGKTTDKIEFIRLCSLTLQHLPTIDNFYSSDFISTIEVKSVSLRTNIQTSFFNAQVACLNLETLKLSAINLSKIWDDDQLCLAFSFQNLANLIVEDCGSLLYLFSSSMVESLKNLKRLEINKCNMMEEILATKERNDDDPSEEVRFSKLEKIIINDMKNLKTLWHYQFQGLKTLEVSKCEKLENIFPSCYTQKAFGSLERLKVSDCPLVEEIFKMNANTLKCQQREEDTAQLRTLILLGLPKLKQIWSKDSQGTLCFYNLQTMQIEYCHSLEYLFPFSIAKDLSQLENLQVLSCLGIKEIVSKKDGAIGETVLFEFNHLASLDLRHLDKLRGFYAGAHTLKCQSLKTINVFNCKLLKLFDVAPIDQLHFPMLQPLFTYEEVIGNLENLTLNYADANMILQHQVPWDLFCKIKLLRISQFEDNEAAFPHLFLQNVPNLEFLVVECSSFKEIFNDETVRGEGGGIQSNTRLKEINLCDLPKLQHIFKEGSQIHPVLQVLEILSVTQCPNLRKLVPSSITFYHLAYLNIEECNSFVHLITSLTARSLAKLETMKLKKCNSLEEIVTEEEDDTKREIAFSSLKVLEMECLPRLNSFSSSKCFLKFPLLEEAVVRECPRMEIFSMKGASSPMLRKVLIEEKDEQWCWEGDLNRTINKMFIDKVAFHSFKHLELSEYPELKDLWYKPIRHIPFSNLKSLVVQECNWLSNVLLPLNTLEALSNLEELEVRSCNSLEVVFNLGGMNESEQVVKETIQLKKIIVENLFNLKQIWKQDSWEIVSFDNSREENVGDDHQRLKTLEASSVDIQPEDPPTLVEKDGFPNLKQMWSKDSQGTLCFHNLQTLQIKDCHRLEYVFPFAIAKDLSQLENLQVISCLGIKEIVSKMEGAIEETVLFEFNHLASLDLQHLLQLRGFYAGAHAIQCQSLKTINVFNCKQLKLFDVESNRSQEMALIDQLHLPILQPLFTVEEVIGNLENLTLNYADANMILQHQVPWDLFCKIKLLRISQFEDDEAAFPHLFLQNVPNLEILVVECSSFKEIFNDETVRGGGGGIQSSTRLKVISLCDLPKLHHIFKEGSQIHLVLRVLEILTVKQCSNLRNLVPSSITFCRLTYLDIEECNSLIHLITSLTARSLAKLEIMKLKKCNSIEEIVTEEEDDTKSEIGFSNLKILELECLPRLNSFSSSKCLLKFPVLEKAIVRECPRMEIFSMKGASSPILRNVLMEEKDKQWYWEGDLNRTIKKMFIDKVAFHSFKHLELSEYPELKDLWCRPIGHMPFSNLKSLVVQECDWLSNVLLPLNMLQALSNLEVLEVRNCDSLEAVFDLGGMNESEVVVKETIQLKKIIVKNLFNLKQIWKQDSREIVSFDNSREEHVGDDHRPAKTLEASSVDIQPKDSACLVEKDGFPNLKQMWSKDSQGTLCFHNLQTLQIKDCHRLEYVFPFAIAKDLSQLENLQVISCLGIKEIVSKMEGAIEETVLFEFNHLASLDLQHLLQLRGFYAGAHAIQCQSLKTINVFNCKQLKLFDVESNRSQEMALIDQLHLPILQPLFTVEEVIGNLENLTLNYADANMILQHQVPWDLFCKIKLLRISQFEDDEAAFPHLFLQNVPNLEILVVECSSFKEIFNDETVRGGGGGIQSSTRLKVIGLCDLPKLHHIFKEGSQIHLVLRVLEILTVKQCSNLRNLVPSSITFCRLTYLDIEDCNSLIHLITSLTARSLAKLETMKLKKCNLIEEIVTEEEDDTKSEIGFSNLKILELECLPRLNSFSSSKCLLKFPVLEKAIVRECPRMEIFSMKGASSPILRKVLMEEKDKQWCWEGDLNRTIKKMFIDKVAFHSFKHLELSKYPELKELWYKPIGHMPFSNMKSLVVQECDWLSNVLLPLNMLQALSNLEVLEVRNCDSLEAVFDLGGMNESEVVVKETIQLKKIIVKSLFNLKQIWKQDRREIVSFDNSREEHVGDDHRPSKTLEASSVDIQPKDSACLVEKTRSGVPQKKVGFYNLQVLVVEHCKDLEYLFPFCIAMDLLYIEEIRVFSCGIKELVANKEGPIGGAATFVFKHLFSLKLIKLEELQRFYAGNYSLACPSLKSIDVFSCNKLELFTTQFINSQERGFMDDGNSIAIRQSREQPLFTVEEVIPNLEELTLNTKVANMILQDQYSGEPFTKLKLLRVTMFEDEEITFPDWFLENAPCLETLFVFCSSFKQVFRDDRPGSNQGNNNVHSRLKVLELIELPELQHICKEGSQIDPIIDFLEILSLSRCSNMKHLVPSSARFGHLTYLEIQKCDGLRHLIASPTARSLVNLRIMKIIECSSLEQIVTKDRDETIDEITFERLKVLELTCLSSFNSFCSGKQKLIFSSLGQLKITGCPRLQNFTSGVIVAPILAVVEVESGTKRWKGDINTTINQLFNEKIAFRSFKQLELSKYPELKELWYKPIGHMPFSNLKSLMVQECDWLSNVLLPLNMLQALSSLEELEVRNCDSLEILFDLGGMNESEVVVKDTIQLKKINVANLANLKHIWMQDTKEIVSFDNSRDVLVGDDHQQLKTLEASSVDILPKDPPTLVEKDGFPNLKQISNKDSQGTLCFYNLQTMQITYCHSLEYLFPFSIAKNLSNLENLQVISCDGIKEIVSKDGAIERTVLFELNHLASLDLQHLIQLRGFYAGAHTLQCQSLKTINVFNCKQLKVFDVESNRSQEMVLIDQLHFQILQPLFTVEEVIGNLEKLTLNYADANMILQHQFPWNLFCKLKLLRISQFEDEEAAFPHWFLQNVPNLEILVVEWSSFKEIFNDEIVGGEGGGNQSSKRLKVMNLYDLPILQHIFKEGSKIHPVLQVLEILIVKQCCNLRNLVPSSVRICHLTYLEIENCNGFINLITSLTARSLVKLETMKLKKCNSLEEIVTEEEDDTKSEIAFGSLKILELECLPRLNSFSSCKCFLKFPLLEKALVRECPRMEIFSIKEASSPMLRKVLFEEKDERWCWEGDLSRTINKMFIDKVALHCFKHLELSEYPELKELWYRPFRHRPFSNLKSLVVQECDWLSNALLPLNMLQALSNLEELEVRNCDSLEIVFDLGGMNESEVVMKETIQLKKITIANLANLKHIWKQETKEIVSFDNSRDVLVGDDHQQLKTLEASSVDILPKDPPTLVETDGFPNLKQIWSKDSQGTLFFYNLQTMQITYCHSLEYLFPFSIAKDLSNLESLQVISCDGIKEIVSKKDGPIERTVLFELNHLASLDLQHLIKLRGFYAGAHTLKCESLKTINVFNCKQLKLFDVESNRSHEIALIDQLQFPMLQHLFTVEEVIGNLENLTLNYADSNMILQHQLPWNLFCKLKLLRISQFEDDEAAFPHWFLQNVPNLEILIIEWSSFKEIFNDETVGGEGGRNQSSIRLKEMNLYDLPILQHIFKEGSQIHPVLQVLEILIVKQCCNLRNLVPSSVRFCHLTYLEIEDCNGFIHLITSLTARSLLKLKTMKLKKCNSLEEIVTEEEDDTKSEIAFSSLKILELECLPRLNSFSSCQCFLKFPLLEKAVVRECPRMEIFSIKEASSPMLRKVLFEEKDKQWCWEGDLSRTINKMFIDKVAFHSFKHLELSEYPELKELWYRPIGHRPFSNLKSLVVQECDWLSNVVLPLKILQALFNLEELEVRNCESLEAVFDLDGMNESEVDVKETIQLKKIIVENLANLKHIWKQGTQEIISFDNTRAEHIGDDHKRLRTVEGSSVDIQPKDPPTLVEKLKTWNGDPSKILGFHKLQAVTVEDCKDLEYLFPFSTFMDLQFLEKIEARRCGIKEIFAKEGDMDKTATFVLNHLSSLVLYRLDKLERFCTGNYSLTCPSLKILDVSECKKLELFKTLSMSPRERRVMVDKNSIAMNQSVVPKPLFIVEEVIPNLEQLTLDKRYANMIIQTQYSQSQNLFNKLKCLVLYDYEDDESTFPYWFLHNIANLEELLVQRSSFEVIFHDKEVEINTRIKYLGLYDLDKLQTICQEGSKIGPVLDTIKILDVSECSNLKNLVPSSLTFSNLGELYVKECNGLIDLFTSSTARSLIHLTIMEIRECSSLEQVVAEVGDELGDEIAVSNLKEEITFESLEDLELTCLSSFKSFCSGKHTLAFSSLKNLTITGCPKMQNFSSGVIIAPMLMVVKFENGTKRRKGDLNSTINQLFVEKQQEVVDSDRS